MSVYVIMTHLTQMEMYLASSDPKMTHCVSSSEKPQHSIEGIYKARISKLRWNIENELCCELQSISGETRWVLLRIDPEQLHSFGPLSNTRVSSTCSYYRSLDGGTNTCTHKVNRTKYNQTTDNINITMGEAVCLRSSPHRPTWHLSHMYMYTTHAVLSHTAPAVTQVNC